MDLETQDEQIRCLQMDALKIAKEIDRICRAKNIGYFICGGTMLGYVRHGGFIPWDDDMDLGMLRADYDRFLEIAATELGDEFFLQTRESEPNAPYLFSKVRLKNTEYVTTYNQYRDFDRGICVDIFPFDKIPLEYGAFSEHKQKVDSLSAEHNKIVNRAMFGNLPSEKPKGLREILEKAVMTVRYGFYQHQPLSETQAAYDKQVTKYNCCNDLHYVASFVPTFTCIRLDELLPYQDVDFEGFTLSAPAHPEVFLQMQYGDYMTLPLPHERHGHDLLRWKGTEHSSEEFE